MKNKTIKPVCPMCKYGQKTGICEEAQIWITKKGVMDCLSFEPLTVGNEDGGQEK